MSLRGTSRCFSFWVDGTDADALEQFIRAEQGRSGADIKKSAIIRKLVMKGLEDETKGKCDHGRRHQSTGEGHG